MDDDEDIKSKDDDHDVIKTWEIHPFEDAGEKLEDAKKR